MQTKWKKGNGTYVVGTIFVLLILALLVSFMSVYQIHLDEIKTQATLDAITDGTAYYTANNPDYSLSDGDKYRQAEDEARKINGLIQTETNRAGISNLSLDRDAFQNDSLVQASANYLGEGKRGDDPANMISATTFSSNDYVEWALKTAEDNRVGYSQAYRRYIYNSGGRMDVDCSSFVFYSLYETGNLNGESPSSPFSTGNEVEKLRRHGFYEVPLGATLQVGDILIKEPTGGNGHTEIYIGNGKTVGAHDDYDGRPGDSSGREVSVANIGSWYGRAFRKG